MTSTTPTRIITITLALLALSAPVAGAMPLGDDGTTAVPTQDLRNPDQQAPAPTPFAYQDLRNPDLRAPAPPVPLTPYTPVELTKPAPVADDGGLSPLVFILPTLVLVAMLGAAVIYTRSSRPARLAPRARLGEVTDPARPVGRAGSSSDLRYRLGGESGAGGSSRDAVVDVVVPVDRSAARRCRPERSAGGRARRANRLPVRRAVRRQRPGRAMAGAARPALRPGDPAVPGREPGRDRRRARRGARDAVLACGQRQPALGNGRPAESIELREGLLPRDDRQTAVAGSAFDEAWMDRSIPPTAS